MQDSMLSYKDFIKLMESRGYILRDNSPINIHELSPGVYTYNVKKESIGKFLEIECLHNTIISVCGKNHPGGCDKSYSCSIKCFDEENKEPYQGFHQCAVMAPNKAIIADIIVTKVLQKEIDKNGEKIQEQLSLNSSILSFIGSKDPCEYPAWNGNYKSFHNEFLNDSINLYSREKMIFYAIKPDVDITRVELELKADIFDKL